jgi:hypothetical protein
MLNNNFQFPFFIIKIMSILSKKAAFGTKKQQNCMFKNSFGSQQCYIFIVDFFVSTTDKLKMYKKYLRFCQKKWLFGVFKAKGVKLDIQNSSISQRC